MPAISASPPDMAHAPNSSATMSRPDLAFDLVLLGIPVYGLSPSLSAGNGTSTGDDGEMCCRAGEAGRAGEGVSYAHTWIAERDTTVALLPVGYADGVFRSLGGRLDVLINGRLRPGVGRICMDQFSSTSGPAGQVAEGDEAILFGPGTWGEPTAQTGPICSAPSTTKWSPARGVASPEPIARLKPFGTETKPGSAAGAGRGLREGRG